MSQNLVIVESPAKVKTIKKFLGKKYDVAARMILNRSTSQSAERETFWRISESA